MYKNIHTLVDTKERKKGKMTLARSTQFSCTDSAFNYRNVIECGPSSKLQNCTINNLIAM
jgi:hypothetical protein